VSDLARAAGTSRSVVNNFERGDASGAITVEAIQRALEEAGIIFIEAKDGGPGARLRKGSSEAGRPFGGDPRAGARAACRSGSVRPTGR
jgi:transcriptional regulator with XRE-family HTH domain